MINGWDFYNDKSEVYNPDLGMDQAHGCLLYTSARCLLPEIQKFFESEEGKREFEEWKKEQENKDK